MYQNLLMKGLHEGEILKLFTSYDSFILYAFLMHSYSFLYHVEEKITQSRAQKLWI